MVIVKQYLSKAKLPLLHLIYCKVKIVVASLFVDVFHTAAVKTTFLF